MNDKKQISKTVGKLSLFAVGMFAFGFALIPLYDIFCEITGANGKTGRLEEQVAMAGEIDESRWVTVEFIGSVNDKLGWKFKPDERRIKVHPGAIMDATFTAINMENREVIGRAVPSVAPSSASRYFNKTECFCFTEQTLKANEVKTMPLRFIVDSKLPKKIKTITLAYTFYPVEMPAVAKVDKLDAVISSHL